MGENCVIMKYFIFSFFVVLTVSLNAQIIGGEIVNEGRKLMNEVPFVVESYSEGFVTLELSVDRNGSVVSRRVVESNVKSTPSMIAVKNHVMKYKFEPGTHYPTFHHVTIKIQVVKK